ncbi:MAG: hypothetical protein GXP15_16920 [Gammaproteobacteria bacterium]|nr:hypothetical protein [Gammaproteobacteria bacterium]
MSETIQQLTYRSGALLLVLLLQSLALGAEIVDIEVDRDGRRYTLVSTTLFDASPERVFAVLIDYDQLARISPTIKDSRHVESTDDGPAVVYSRIGACVFFYCKTVEKYEYLEFVRPTYILTTAIPERSDVIYSQSEWSLEASGNGGTTVVYRLEFEPDFWVPPLIGPMVIKRALVADGAIAVEQIEILAQKLANFDATNGR